MIYYSIQSIKYIFTISIKISNKNLNVKRNLLKIKYKTRKSNTKYQFLTNSLELKNFDEKVYNYLMENNLEYWVLCYSEYPCMLYTTSPIESFNGVILKERKNSLVDMLIGIRSICSQLLLKQKKKLHMQFNNVKMYCCLILSSIFKY